MSPCSAVYIKTFDIKWVSWERVSTQQSYWGLGSSCANHNFRPIFFLLFFLSLSLSNSFKTTAASEKGRTCINHRDLGLCTLQSAQTPFQRYLLPFNTYQNLFKTRGRVCFLLSRQHIKLLPYGSASWVELLCVRDKAAQEEAAISSE